MTSWNFAEIFGVRKLSPWAIVWRCLRDPTFNRFDIVAACDGQTDRQTDRHKTPWLGPHLTTMHMLCTSGFVANVMFHIMGVGI